MDIPEEVRRILAEFVTAFDKHMVERNRLHAESMRQYDRYMEQERRRLDLTEESHRLQRRSLENQEAELQRQRERSAEIRRQQRWLARLAILVPAALIILIVLFASGVFK
jgi:hypothetical protein